MAVSVDTNWDFYGPGTGASAQGSDPHAWHVVGIQA